MTRHLWVLVVLPWDGFLVSFSVGLFPSGVGCRRLYCGSRIFCRSDWDSGITIELIPVLGNWCCQLLLFEAATWVTRSMLSSFVVEAATWVTMDAVNLLLSRQHLGFWRRPILYKLKFCMIRRRSFSELQWLELSQTCLRWDRSRSIRFSVSEVDLLFFRVWDGSLLRSIRFSEVGLMSLNAAVGWCNGLSLKQRRCWRIFSFRTCLWYRRWLNRSITSGFCPHCLYEAKEAIHFRLLDRLQIFC